ncbi:EmrB/QacA subfamily drug resistance transporter [Actinoalloteichus hoggarensis]|uniref:Multidrug resistance protein stp n=1 Tax=Actinoalloteichus hoggarensis TaxID=1470176 RepID=A0A221VZ25_9PSEU|nr:DHA2 family efflux MFS transporter permease subunit [Actinoalloteichus hoggarensis]ASO18491.1 Multidrug resistance protein stp [Actinoalloteichus hoggarensis]MBB5921859.1 EmrB/QacA subfamily drug resistance transporter [Actinoalloteichus hoggarensis]
MPVQRPPAHRWLGLIAVTLGVAMIVADTTIVTVIVPSIIGDLGIESGAVQWLHESYVIVFAALLLLVGRISDLVGARRVFQIGVVAFGVTSVLAALAPDGDVLLTARMLQGVGAASILPTSLALVNAAFTGRDRGRAFAVWGSTIGAAAALGPLLGGALAEISWRWAFGVNIPLGVIIVLGVRMFLPPSPRRAGRVDTLGAVASVIGLGLLAFALVEGRVYGWIVTVEPLRIAGLTWDRGPSPVLVALLASAAILTLFVRRQLALDQAGEQPLMDARLFSIGSFRNGGIAALIISMGEFGIVAVLPLWLQFTLGYSALQTGLVLLPLALGSLLASGIVFATASVPPLRMVRVGLLTEIAGLAALGWTASADSTAWAIAATLFVYGVGVGLASAQVTNVMLADVPADRANQGSAVSSAARELGSALGIAALTTAFFSTLSHDLHHRLTAAGTPPEESLRFAAQVTDSAGAAITRLAADPHTVAVAEAADAAMAHGVSLVSHLAAGLLVLGLAATALIPRAPSPSPTGTSAPGDPVRP